MTHQEFMAWVMDKAAGEPARRRICLLKCLAEISGPDAGRVLDTVSCLEAAESRFQQLRLEVGGGK